MMIPASFITALRALNSGHIIATINQQQNIMVDGSILSPKLYLTAAFGGTGSYTKDQIEGYNLLTSSQQTVMVTYFNSLISSLLTTNATNTLVLAILGYAQFTETAIAYVPLPKVPDNTFSFRTTGYGSLVDGQTEINALTNQQGGGTTQNIDIQIEAQTYAAFLAGTLTAAVVTAKIQMPH